MPPRDAARAARRRIGTTRCHACLRSHCKRLSRPRSLPTCLTARAAPLAHVLPLPRTPAKSSEACTVCEQPAAPRGGGGRGNLLECDGCQSGYHMCCIIPQCACAVPAAAVCVCRRVSARTLAVLVRLQTGAVTLTARSRSPLLCTVRMIPKGDWLCPACTGEGLVKGKTVRRLAVSASRACLSSEGLDAPQSARVAPLTPHVLLMLSYSDHDRGDVGRDGLPKVPLQPVRLPQVRLRLQPARGV